MKLTAEALSSLPSIRHGFFTREGGVSTGIYASLNCGVGSSDDRDAVAQNRSRVAAELGVSPEDLVTPYQIHSAEAVIVDEPWRPGEGPKADALVTRRTGLAIGVGTADCGPILFADGEAGVIGAAHAGWKGAFTGILEATLAAMEAIGAKRERITAVLGPTISGPAYEVGPEFRERFLGEESANERYFRPSDRADHFRFDLPAYIAGRLRRAAIGRFDDLGLCTYSDPTRFFSFRRTTHLGEADYGRLLHAIAILP